MKPTTNWEELSNEASQDRRSERRILLSCPIEVSGFNNKGEFFTERTTTADISESGCRFQVKAQVETGAILALKLISRHNSETLPKRPFLYEVARVTPERDGWTLGVVKLQPESIWCVLFPGQDKQKRSAT
jgi:hypothetical protein